MDSRKPVMTSNLVAKNGGAIKISHWSKLEDATMYADVSPRHRKVLEIKRIQDKVFHRTKSTDKNSNRRQYTYTLMKESKKNKQTSKNRARSELLGGDAGNNLSRASNGSRAALPTYADFHIKKSELDERMNKLYKVRQEICFEFTETEKHMKYMKEIMEGGADAVIPVNEGFDNSGTQKGNSSSIAGDPIGKGHGQDKDGDDLISGSDIDSQNEDDSTVEQRDWGAKSGGRQTTILRRRSNASSPDNSHKGHHH